MKDLKMDELVSLCKRRGFIYPGSEIYGGLANTWDYGHLGSELKNNIKTWWWHNFVHMREDIIGLDSSILMNPQVWKTSGHIDGFSDPLMDCRNCKTRHRADKLIEDVLAKKKIDRKVEGLNHSDLKALVDELKINCPNCGKSDFTDIRSFNLMFKTKSRGH